MDHKKNAEIAAAQAYYNAVHVPGRSAADIQKDLNWEPIR